jgi:ribosome biogenesis protein MAK21
MTENTSNQKKRRRGRKSEGSLVVSGNDTTTTTNTGESVTNYSAHKTPLIQLDEDTPTWYEYGSKLPGRNDTLASDPQPRDAPNNHSLVGKYRGIGDVIFQKEIQLTGGHGGGDKNDRWVENTMKKGTLKDRIAAMSVTVSNDPVHKFYALDGLLAMVGCSESGGKTNSRVAQLTAEAVEDLFLNTFLPSNRKLLTLAQRPLYRYETDKNGNRPKKTLSPRLLLLWRFEEMVREKYELYLRNYMTHTLHDGAEMQKISTLKSAANMLRSAPEAESQLLAMMVNKLGDPAKKTAAAAGHQLRLVLQEHPAMQMVIAREVQQLAHRPHLAPKALYNCIVFLNQLKLEKKEDDPKKPSAPADAQQQQSLPASLIKTYFRLFEVAVKKNVKTKKDVDPESEEAGMKSRLLSALL